MEARGFSSPNINKDSSLLLQEHTTDERISDKTAELQLDRTLRGSVSSEPRGSVGSPAHTAPSSSSAQPPQLSLISPALFGRSRASSWTQALIRILLRHGRTRTRSRARVGAGSAGLWRVHRRQSSSEQTDPQAPQQQRLRPRRSLGVWVPQLRSGSPGLRAAPSAASPLSPSMLRAGTLQGGQAS